MGNMFQKEGGFSEKLEKKISIIVPCFNVENWVDRCIRSLVRQTIGIENLELIFVDDASTDGTLGRLKKWEKRFPDSVLIIACEQNGRQGTARNIGLAYASAPYIGYVDADDWVEKDMYELLYQCALEKDVEVVACMQGRDVGDGKLRDIKSFGGAVDQRILLQTEQDRHDFLKYGMPGGVVTKIYRHEFLSEHSLSFPEQVAYEDNYFGMLLNFEVTSVYILDKVCYHYFYNTESTVTIRNSKHQIDRIVVEEQLFRELKQRGFLEKYLDEIYSHYLGIYYLNTLHLLFTRFDELPIDELKRVREFMLVNFPEWKHCSYYTKLTAMERGFLQALEVEMSEEKWENLKENYLYLIKRNTVQGSKNIDIVIGKQMY